MRTAATCLVLVSVGISLGCARRTGSRPVTAPGTVAAAPHSAPAAAPAATPASLPVATSAPGRSLAQVATASPAAARVLHRHGIDFCCGGDQTLEAAARAKGLTERGLLEEIAAAERETPPAELVRWDERPPAELIAHLVRRYHVSLREELPRLIALSRTVDRVHAEKPDVPVGLTDHLVALYDDVLRHLADEEQRVFPSIEAGQARRGDAAVAALETDHQALARALHRTRDLTQGLVAPPAACATWKALYGGLERLELDIMVHAHLENHVLFAGLPRT